MVGGTALLFDEEKLIYFVQSTGKGSLYLGRGIDRFVSNHFIVNWGKHLSENKNACRDM